MMERLTLTSLIIGHTTLMYGVTRHCYLIWDQITDILFLLRILYSYGYPYSGDTLPLCYGYVPDLYSMRVSSCLPYAYPLMLLPLCLQSYKLTPVLGFSQQPLRYSGTLALPYTCRVLVPCTYIGSQFTQPLRLILAVKPFTTLKLTSPTYLV